MAAVTIAPMQAAVPRSSAFKVSVTAIGAAVLLGIMVGVLSTHEELGDLVRIGTPWVTAAFALGALVGWQTRAWTAGSTAIVASIAGVVCLTVANGIYYGIFDPLGMLGMFGGGFAQTFTVVGGIVGVAFGVGGSAWGRSRTSAGATLAVAALAAVVMIDPLVTQALMGGRQFAPATIVVQMLIGLSLPFLLLPRARRRGRHC